MTVLNKVQEPRSISKVRDRIQNLQGSLMRNQQAPIVKIIIA